MKKVHETAYLIKSDDDISILDKYLSVCFTGDDSYYLADVSDQPNRFIMKEAEGVVQWLDDL
ncbi:hypothetical protein CR205_10515 [Alteribacter lacisalsi]|uniref:Uncharacterized protein n=1 Tax=Alteribacter lacisalsi TaxID=2045244 RepID=A0A2W0HAU0_9BACI|nr:hypothetical protein CR205_10515 [Alteribacter lacisalsi]